MSRKTKVLSVRLPIEALQSCFDLCEVLEMPTNSASSAISRSLSCLMADLRDKATLPTYREEELVLLVKSFLTAKNPTTMPSLEKLETFETGQMRPVRRHSYTNQDFVPNSIGVSQREGVSQTLASSPEDEISIEDLDLELAKTRQQKIEEQQDLEEYNKILEEKIREQMLLEDAELLAKIMIS